MPSTATTNTTYTPENAKDVTRILRAENFYDILQIPKGATDEDVKRAYRKLSLRVHPDKNRHPGASEACKALNKAVETLSSEKKRRLYDESLRSETVDASPVYMPADETNAILVIAGLTLVGLALGAGIAYCIEKLVDFLSKPEEKEALAAPYSSSSSVSAGVESNNFALSSQSGQATPSTAHVQPTPKKEPPAPRSPAAVPEGHQPQSGNRKRKAEPPAAEQRSSTSTNRRQQEGGDKKKNKTNYNNQS